MHHVSETRHAVPCGHRRAQDDTIAEGAVRVAGFIAAQRAAGAIKILNL
jgi:hypothetical protein